MDNRLENLLEARLRKHEEDYIKVKFSSGIHQEKVAYGTAGFRGNADKIEHIFFNIGVIAALRCLHLKANVGVMITASHNPIEDNGVKLIDSRGEMLSFQWEELVEDVCNTHEVDKLMIKLKNIIDQFNIDLEPNEFKILIGMDTRPSSDALATLVKSGIRVWESLVAYLDCHIVSTPALHYLVAESNLRGPCLSIHDYYVKLASTISDNPGKESSCKLYSPHELVVDCANGVGSETMRHLCSNVKFNELLPVRLINTYEGILNRNCGADYVKTTHKVPAQANDTRLRYASLDGDADRLVYFYIEDNKNDLKLKLLDGDKILALYSLFLRDQVNRCQLADLKLGVIQTAYANGASTDYIQKTLNIKVDCVQTGVKNLHHQALNYDLAIYFEANGHGTIWISEKARNIILGRSDDDISPLRHLISCINNYTGDAISDMLLVELILRHYDWDIREWDKLYADRPSSLIKVEVSDRTKIKTVDGDRICSQPDNLQPAIDSLVSTYGKGARCFVRPSGTEDVVRIYAEAATQESALDLANKVAEKLKEILA